MIYIGVSFLCLVLVWVLEDLGRCGAEGPHSNLTLPCFVFCFLVAGVVLQRATSTQRKTKPCFIVFLAWFDDRGLPKKTKNKNKNKTKNVSQNSFSIFISFFLSFSCCCSSSLYVYLVLSFLLFLLYVLLSFFLSFFLSLLLLQRRSRRQWTKVTKKERGDEERGMRK